MVDRRHDTRRRVCLGGLIETAAFLPEIACTVRDVSLTGARIRIAAETTLPGRVVLRVPLRRECRLGRVVWQAGDMVGLHFEPDEADNGTSAMHRQFQADQDEIARLRAALVARTGGTSH